ncbi:MAG: UTP--glucose-1-phosphate uridylyltransferase [Planctomycetota bacterium]
MTSINRELVSQIRKYYCDAGQGHVFTWWDDLSSEERELLFKQLTNVDLELMNRLAETNLTQKTDKEARVLEPAPIIRLARTTEEKAIREKARAVGQEVIKRGKCAAFVVAGSGNPTLDHERVKGKFPITPVTGKSLFQLHTEKVLGLRRRYDVNIPLFVMTSQDNHDETRSFFEQHGYFGMSGEDIFFFAQGMLPVVDLSGKLLMQNRGSLFMSPDGHGGSIRSLHNSGAIEEMESRGIDYIFYFQVDNALTQILDPVFVGYHHMEKAEISSKVVQKRSPEERVGVVGKINGCPSVVEYSDLSKEDMYARDENGQLKFLLGNIAIHMLNVSFVRRLSTGNFKLNFRKTMKSIDCIDEKGEAIQATGHNAIKFESYVFDALQYTNETICLEVAREEEFSPFKSLKGEDSPEVCRLMLSNFYRTWIERAGFQCENGDNPDIEISPLFALDAEEFCFKIKQKNKLLSRKLFIE